MAARRLTPTLCAWHEPAGAACGRVGGWVGGWGCAGGWVGGWGCAGGWVGVRVGVCGWGCAGGGVRVGVCGWGCAGGGVRVGVCGWRGIRGARIRQQGRGQQGCRWAEGGACGRPGPARPPPPAPSTPPRRTCQRDAGHPHVQALAGGGRAGVGEGVQADVHQRVLPQVVRVGHGQRQQVNPPGLDAYGRRAAGGGRRR
jgi:hypothetical protein